MILLVLIALTPMLAMILVTYSQKYQEIYKCVEEQCVKETTSFEIYYTRIVSGSRELLISLSQSSDFQTMNSEHLTKLFKRIKSLIPVYANIIALNKDGDIFASAEPFHGKFNSRNIPYFSRVIRDHKFSFGDFWNSRLLNIPIIICSYPVFDEQKNLLAVVASSLNLNYINEEIKNLYIPDKGVMIALDSSGKVISFPSDYDKVMGRKFFSEDDFKQIKNNDALIKKFKGIDDIERLYCFKHIGDNQDKLFIGSGVSLSAEINTLNKQLYRDMIWFWLSFLIAFIAVLFMAKLISNSERRLLQSKYRNDLIIDASIDGFFVVDKEGRFIEVNSTYCKMIGYSKEELLTMKVSDIEALEGPEEIKKHIQSVFENGFDRFETKHRRKDGVILDIEVSVKYNDIDGAFYAGFFNDITERKKVEAEVNKYKRRLEIMVLQRTRELTREKEKLLKAQKIANIGSWEYYSESEKLELSPVASDILELENVSQIDFKTLRTLIYSEDVSFFNSHWAMLLSGNQMDSIFRFKSKSALKYIRIVSSLTSNTEEQVKSAIGYFFDLTKDVENETKSRIFNEKVYEIQKMESLGTLSAGIAHNFNNILTCIIGFANVLKDECKKGSNAREHVNMIIQQGERAVYLAKQMLFYSSPEKTHMLAVDMPLIINDSLSMIQMQFDKAGVSVKKSIDAECKFVFGDPHQIHQLLINMFKNALEAMPNGGHFHIMTRCVSFDLTNLPLPNFEAGKYLELVLEDDGEGMTPEAKRKIFEPYFSTKSVGKGTGLGLFTVYNTMLNHKGGVTVESQPGKGATFKIYFHSLEVKLEDRTIEEVKKDDLPFCYTKSCHARVLIVEDEAIIKMLYKAGLEKLGYKITIASDGEEALIIFKAKPKDFDVVITDQMMPKMLGTELCREVLRIRPEIPVILVTGFSNESEINAKAAGVSCFLRKPCSPQVLSDTIRKNIN